jgi:membrane associated rhomboid family serine protease
VSAIRRAAEPAAVLALLVTVYIGLCRDIWLAAAAGTVLGVLMLVLFVRTAPERTTRDQRKPARPARR